MFIKQITCKVKKKDVFLMQAKWDYLNTLEGFVDQIGGWTDKKAHTNDLQNTFHRLIKESDVNADVSMIYGDQVVVEKSWLLY
ncbi:hypothetical protein J26TS2_26810 [Shouchella clausii]|nr:hypothetical protein J26TS2_26810 [Shouchella clausii]